jgi:single-strand DNA-binding protein
VFNKRRKLPDGTWEDGGSLFVRATVWDQMAEHCAECLDKGHDVIVSGELSQREYEKSDGSKGQSLDLRIDDLGPSMRNATVKVNKVSRSSDGGFGGSSSAAADDPWGSAPASGDSEMPPF